MLTLIEDIDVSTVPFSSSRLVYLDQRNIVANSTSIRTVDLSKVRGTTHPDYAGLSWGELKPVPGTVHNPTDPHVAIQPLKRAVSNCQQLVQNPKYYTSMGEKEYWSFYLIDDEYYVSNGNNRTVIARFFFHLNSLSPMVHGISVTTAKWMPDGA